MASSDVENAATHPCQLFHAERPGENVFSSSPYVYGKQKGQPWVGCPKALQGPVPSGM